MLGQRRGQRFGGARGEGRHVASGAKGVECCSTEIVQLGG